MRPFILCPSINPHTHHFPPLPKLAMRPWMSNAWLGLQTRGGMTFMRVGTGPSQGPSQRRRAAMCELFYLYVINGNHWQELQDQPLVSLSLNSSSLSILQPESRAKKKTVAESPPFAHEASLQPLWVTSSYTFKLILSLLSWFYSLPR